MKVSILEAKEAMRKLVRAGAEFTWMGDTIQGSWLQFNIKSVYIDHVENLLDGISDDFAYEIDSEGGIASFHLLDFTRENTSSDEQEAIQKRIIKVRQWLTQRQSNPIPMRVMEGVILRETAKAMQVRLSGHLQPSSTCNHCGRRLTHAVSLLYGLGPICGRHFHINPCRSEEELKERYEEMKRKMESVTWEGWIPKAHLEVVS